MKRKPFVTTSPYSPSSSSIAEVVEEQTQQKKKQTSSHFSSSPSSSSSSSFLSRFILTAIWSIVAISSLLYAPLAIETLFYVFTDYDSPSCSSSHIPTSRRRSLRLVTRLLEMAGGKKYATGEGSVEHEQTETYLLMRSWLILHTISSSIAILIGPFQITDVIRQKLMKRSPEIHRALGQIYLLCVGLGSFGSFVFLCLTPTSNVFVGPSFQWTLWALWLVTLASAISSYRAIAIHQDIKRHLCWTIVNYLSLWQAPSLRIVWILSGWWFAKEEIGEQGEVRSVTMADVTFVEGAMSGLRAFTIVLFLISYRKEFRSRALHLGSPVVSLILLGLAAVTVPIFFLVEPAQLFEDRASHDISLSHLLPSTLLSQLALASSALIAPMYMYRTLSLSFFVFPTFSAYTALNSPASITRAVKEKEKEKGKSKENGLSHLNRPLRLPSQHRYSLEDLKIVWLSPLVPLLYGVSTFMATYSLLCEFYEGWNEESPTSFSFDREQLLGYCTWLQIALGSFFFFICAQYKDFQARILATKTGGWIENSREMAISQNFSLMSSLTSWSSVPLWIFWFFLRAVSTYSPTESFAVVASITTPVVTFAGIHYAIVHYSET